MTSKRKTENVGEDVMEIMPLGAGNEVGRSSVWLKFKNKQVLFDAGVHPAHTGLAALPYFDMIDDPAEIDVLLVTHFHLDHCASVPYFTEKTTFKGRIFMTHPTKAVFKLILSDFVKVSNISSSDDQLYTEQDLQNCLDKIEVINYHQEVEVNGIKFWCYNAGHVLGAAMFMVEIDDTRVLYTGDFSRQTDRHLMVAELPVVSPDVLIVESTYGKQVHEPREARERRFTESVSGIVSKRRGRCLLPVFALGRAQELLLILDEHWEAHPELHKVPIFYAGALAQRCMSIYQYYIYMMNERIRDQIAVNNPFKFKHISHLKSINAFEDKGPCVVMASPGMLQSGMSRALFEMWCEDQRNGLVIPGYVVEGTLAKDVISEPSHIVKLNGLRAPLRMSVEYISFSAHSDFAQTSEFVDALEPPHILLVHGEQTEMARLKGALVSKYKDRAVRVYNPKNCQSVQISFRSEKIAKTVGALAASAPSEGDAVSGVLVRHHFSHRIMTPTDLRAFTQLQTSLVTQRLRVPFYRPFDAAHRALCRLFDSVRRTTVAPTASDADADADELEAGARGAGGDIELDDNDNDDDNDNSNNNNNAGSNDADNGANNNDDNDADDKTDATASQQSDRLPMLVLHDDVRVVRTSDIQLLVEWESNPISDMIADGVVAALTAMQAQPKLNSSDDNDNDTNLTTKIPMDDDKQHNNTFSTNHKDQSILANSAVRVLKRIYKHVELIEQKPDTNNNDNDDKKVSVKTEQSSSHQQQQPTQLKIELQCNSIKASIDVTTGDIVCDDEELLRQLKKTWSLLTLAF